MESYSHSRYRSPQNTSQGYDDRGEQMTTRGSLA